LKFCWQSGDDTFENQKKKKYWFGKFWFWRKYCFQLVHVKNCLYNKTISPPPGAWLFCNNKITFNTSSHLFKNPGCPYILKCTLIQRTPNSQCFEHFQINLWEEICLIIVLSTLLEEDFKTYQKCWNNLSTSLMLYKKRGVWMFTFEFKTRQFSEIWKVRARKYTNTLYIRCKSDHHRLLSFFSHSRVESNLYDFIQMSFTANKQFQIFAVFAIFSFFPSFSWTPSSSTKKEWYHGTFSEIFRMASALLKPSKRIDGPPVGIRQWFGFNRSSMFEMSLALSVTQDLFPY